MARETIESALRILVHARNSHGALRSTIRGAIRTDIRALRAMERRATLDRRAEREAAAARRTGA